MRFNHLKTRTEWFHAAGDQLVWPHFFSDKKRACRHETGSQLVSIPMDDLYLSGVDAVALGL